jgi:uncharacterized membrane protein
MEKDREKEIMECDKEVSQLERALLVLCGLCNFPVGIALYFYFKDRKDKKYHIEFLKSGIFAGMFLTVAIMVVILVLAIWIAIYEA